MSVCLALIGTGRRVHYSLENLLAGWIAVLAFHLVARLPSIRALPSRLCAAFVTVPIVKGDRLR